MCFYCSTAWTPDDNWLKDTPEYLKRWRGKNTQIIIIRLFILEAFFVIFFYICFTSRQWNNKSNDPTNKIITSLICGCHRPVISLSNYFIRSFHSACMQWLDSLPVCLANYQVEASTGLPGPQDPRTDRDLQMTPDQHWSWGKCMGVLWKLIMRIRLQEWERRC